MERTIKQLYQPLFLYVKKRICNQEDAEDLTQEVFYKLAKSDSDNIKSIKNWVYTIAKNTITDYYRKKKMPTEKVEENTYLEEFTDNTAVTALSKCVTPYINALPEGYKSIMLLSEIEEIPQKEIAKQLDLNYVTVRSKIQRGRKKLKAIFLECCTITQGGKGSILNYQKNKRCDNNQDCSTNKKC